MQLNWTHFSYACVLKLVHHFNPLYKQGRYCRIMNYENIVIGRFIDRQNRFIARVFVGDKIETVHVKNTGRCRELLLPDCRVYLEKSNNPNRKTGYTLIAVDKVLSDGKVLTVNIDSTAPNALIEEWLPISGVFKEPFTIKREVNYGKSRFDFCITDENGPVYIEVKGVTLENQGVVLFPDAPSQRAVKHLNALVECIKCGFRAYVIFVIQLENAEYFTPNVKTHPAFAEALRTAKINGVNILALECSVYPDKLTISKQVDIKL